MKKIILIIFLFLNFDYSVASFFPEDEIIFYRGNAVLVIPGNETPLLIDLE